jgi:hypothetical protein
MGRPVDFPDDHSRFSVGHGLYATAAAPASEAPGRREINAVGPRDVYTKGMAEGVGFYARDHVNSL